jgi:hypothetical protein
MNVEQRQPRVTITTLPLWRLRLRWGLPRYLLQALATLGLVASARFALDPPRATLPASLLRPGAQPDLVAEGFATLFARRYLTWEAASPQAREAALAAYAGAGLEAGAGLQPPAGSAQHVQWMQVVQERAPQPDERVYTVAAQTDAAGLLYLSVSVLHTAAGLALADYPAFVGPPASAATQLQSVAGHFAAVREPALATVVERALRNYLAGAAGELAADLSPSASVSLPALALTLEALQSLQWAPGSDAVLAVVQASDGRGAHYTLAYELDVVRAQGRWEIAAIQMDPDA